MSTENQAGDPFDQLMAIAKETFANSLFNVSYHALAAAYHCAVASNNEQRLYVVERAAREQLRWIDTNAPGYEHSTQSASRRNNISIFLMLSQQAAIKLRYLALSHTSKNL